MFSKFDLTGKTGIFDQLSVLKGKELENKEKNKLFKMIDIKKNNEGYYLDAFENPISFNGIKGLKRSNIKLKLQEIHKNELKICKNDYKYFRRNYCKIKTKEGISRPEPRDYQERAEDALLKGNDTVLFFPRQCIYKDTELNINKNKTIKISDLYNNYKNKEVLNENNLFKSFIYLAENNIKINTPTGYKNITFIYKTKKLSLFEIILENGLSLIGSKNHVIIDKNKNQVFLKDSINKEIITNKGISKVIKVIDLKREDYLYDISLNDIDELYYSNGILSHNSGKTVTIATYLLWKALFEKNVYIGISANVLTLAKEVLDKIKKIYFELPIWLMQGLQGWNKNSIELENGTRVMIAASNGDAFRGFSMNYVYTDEVGFISANEWAEYIDSVMPSMSAIPGSQAIYSSTAAGLNHFYHLVNDARTSSVTNLVEASWEEVPRFKKDGTTKTNKEFKNEIVEKYGELYFAQNYGNSFLGSSSTLITGDALKSIKVMSDDLIIFNSLFNGLKIFEEPKLNHYYVVSLDPKKEGIDNASIQVIDVTNLPFKQVATASLNESFMSLPGKLFDIGNYYNLALVIVENNIGESIPSTLFYNYEYEGEVFIETGKNGKAKKEMGFRTTVKTKRQILTLLKKLIETGNLIINDIETLEELFTFIEKPNGTFSAEGSYHDDRVMALAVSLAPFTQFKNFEDFKGFNEYLEKKKQNQEEKEIETIEFLDLGFSDFMEDEDYKYF